jgi:serine protease AprX
MRKEHIYALLEKDTANSEKISAGCKRRRGDERDAQNTVMLETCRVIHGIWPDFPIKPCITKSIASVKADAALNSFSTLGTDITWAVIDSGIDAKHPHFDQGFNIDPESPLHHDFTSQATSNPSTALLDAFGHGTHVAGIIAGGFDRDRDKQNRTLNAVQRVRVKPTEQESDVQKVVTPVPLIRGMAPKCQLVSLKVLDDVGFGEVSNVIAALSYVLDVNNSGRAELKIHGVNISLGYEIDPEWFACGESPICVEVNRVVRSGVVVVVAAGNTGHGTAASRERSTSVGLDMTINDPGNADLAITVGSTHREMPHRYGVSFFSSKGPTGDGRPKPDLVAPGEKILSCATGALLRDRAGNSETADIHYVEDSGTSMAAPHVSGVIAGFLSVRVEFIGKPERVKEIFCATATDLRRNLYFQGAGLVDLMRAIQSV